MSNVSCSKSIVSLSAEPTEEPVVSFTPEEVSVSEGEEFTWSFNLNQPVPEGGLTLTLPIVANNDPAPGDVEYFVEGSTKITDFDLSKITAFLMPLL